MGDDSAPAANWFLAVEERVLRHRLYRVYVGENFLAGARIAGNVYDEMSFMFFGGCHWLTRRLLAGWKKRKFAERKAREAFYDGVDPAVQDLRAFDPENFHYSANHIVRLSFRFNNSSEIASATGTIRLTTFDGPTRTLTAINYIEPDVVIKLLRSIHPRLEVQGELGYKSILHREQSVARDHTLNGGICCIVLGAMAFIFWATGFRPGLGGAESRRIFAVHWSTAAAKVLAHAEGGGWDDSAGDPMNLRVDPTHSGRMATRGMGPMRF